MSSASVNAGLAVLAEMNIVERKKLPGSLFPIERNGKRIFSSMEEELVVLAVTSWNPPWELEQARIEAKHKKELRQARMKRSQIQALEGK
jgi:hypothetical protein